MGINDFKNLNLRKVVEKIVDFGNFVEMEFLNIKVIILSLLMRFDDFFLVLKIKEVNKILKIFVN